MAIRRVIEINEEKCNGCGICVDACHEGAIGLVDGKAKLMRDDYCDGLGDCLPACPTGAISFIEREAAAYDEAAVEANKAAAGACGMAGVAAGAAGTVGARGSGVSGAGVAAGASPCGCPGAAVREFKHGAGAAGDAGKNTACTGAPSTNTPRGVLPVSVPSEISTWPIQIKLAPVNMPAFDGCNLLIAADCTAFAYGNFHYDFMRDSVCLIGCPKLDAVDYAEKLTQIMIENNIASLTLVRMEVPCCGGLEDAARRALAASGKQVPLDVVTFSLDGRIL